MKTIHILINCYWGSGMSGGDRRTIEMLRRWNNTSEYRFLVYTTHDFARLPTEEGIDKYEIVYTDKEKNGKNIIVEYFKRMAECYRLLKERVKTNDIIYSSTDIMPDVMPGCWIKKKNKTVIWEITTYHLFEKFYKRPGNVFTNFLSCQQQKASISSGVKYADKYFTTSPIVLNYLEKRCKSKKVYLTDCAVDIEAIDRANSEVNGYDACFLARLNYSKGVLELPEIWQKVISERPGAKLAIMGKGNKEFEEELRSKIDNMGVSESIDLLGFMSSEDAWSVIKKSNCFLFTSHEEGWGMAVAEALTAGTPVVAYRLPIFERLFPEGTIYCPFLDIDAMARGVLKVNESYELRASLGKNGSEYIRNHYTLNSMAQKELKYILQ